jgi:sec-independent protein translocase protein TatC
MKKKEQEKEAPTDLKSQFIAHLLELRKRLMVIVISVGVVFLSLLYFAKDIYVFFSQPLQKFLPENSTMIATEVTSPFFAPFKLTLVLSFFIAIPIVLHQVWKFISPALYAKEKKFAVPLLFSSVFLFASGMAFAYYVVFPLIFSFFISAAPENVAVMTDINQYLNFILKIFFAFGMAFQIPIATFLLVATGITTTKSLASKRPYVIVGCFVVGMLITPPDLISQSLIAIPMWMLFEMGIIFARVMLKK